MEKILEWLSNIFNSWKFWVVISPWDIGVRVRLGKTATPLLPGLHLRIPFVDDIILINTRLRVSTTPPTTIKGVDNTAHVISATVGFRIVDPLLTMLSFSNPTIAVLAHTQAEIASGANSVTCVSNLNHIFKFMGIEIDFVRFVEDARIPALRIIQNGYGFGVSDPQELAQHGFSRY